MPENKSYSESSTVLTFESKRKRRKRLEKKATVRDIERLETRIERLKWKIDSYFEDCQNDIATEAAMRDAAVRVLTNEIASNRAQIQMNFVERQKIRAKAAIAAIGRSLG